MMSNVIEVGFGKKPPKEVNGEQAVTLESNFYPFECPFIGSHGVITQFFKEGKTDMTIARGRSGPDAGKLFPKTSDSAYHLLYHIPTNCSKPVATLGNINLKGNSDA